MKWLFISMAIMNIGMSFYYWNLTKAEMQFIVFNIHMGIFTLIGYMEFQS